MDFRNLLRALAGAEVELVVVGGLSAVLQGVPTSTFELGIVHGRSAENRRRLGGVLRGLEACYREHLPKVLTPTEEDLDSDGHLLLMTREGPLDVLGTVGEGRRYEDLVGESVAMDVGGGVRVRVLGLEALVRLKERSGREKDRAQLPLLRRTLEERGG